VQQGQGSDGRTRQTSVVRVRLLLAVWAGLSAATAARAWAVPPQMLASDENSGSNLQLFTFSRFSVGMSANRYLIVGVDVVGAAVSSVSWDSQALGAIGVAAASGGGCRTELWGVANPTAGTHTLTVMLNQNAPAVVGVVAFGGVDQVNPTGSFAQVAGANSSVNITIPGVASSFIVGSACLGGNWPASISNAPSGQATSGSPLWDSTQADVVGLGAGRVGGGAGSNVSWSIAGNGHNFVWAAGGVALNPVGTAPPDAAPPPDTGAPDRAADVTMPAVDAPPPVTDAPPPATDARPAGDGSGMADRTATDALSPVGDALVPPEGDQKDGPPGSSVDAAPGDADGSAGADGGATIATTRLAVGCACRAARPAGSGGVPIVLVISLLLIHRRSRCR
jgi:hypothetical protein